MVSGAHGYAVALRMLRFRSLRGSEMLSCASTYNFNDSRLAEHRRGLVSAAGFVEGASVALNCSPLSNIRHVSRVSPPNQTKPVQVVRAPPLRPKV